MNKFLGLVILVVFVFSSCVTPPVVNHSYPQFGSSGNATLAVKDFAPVGLIFVTSSETIDSLGNHRGSKITYEMLMREAQKLDANDVINIKIDVNQVVEVTNAAGFEVVKTTFNYTASALAIRYTNAIAVEGRGARTQDISNAISHDAEEMKSDNRLGLILGISGGVLGLMLTGLLIALSSGNAESR